MLCQIIKYIPFPLHLENIILRDGIHTTPFGAEEYAKLINEEFQNLSSGSTKINFFDYF